MYSLHTVIFTCFVQLMKPQSSVCQIITKSYKSNMRKTADLSRATQTSFTDQRSGSKYIVGKLSGRKTIKRFLPPCYAALMQQFV